MKTMIDKVFILLLVFVLAALSAACGKAGEPADLQASGVPVSEASTPDEPASDELHGSEDSKLETGIIVYSDGATLMICSPDGRNLSFLVAGDEVDKSGARGLVAGSEADVYYIGVIDGGNTSAAQVTKLSQSQKQAEIRTDVNVTGGIILESDSTALKLSTFGGDEWTFLIAGGGVDMSKTNGLAEGDYVTVFYEGEIINGEAGGVKVTKLVQ